MFDFSKKALSSSDYDYINDLSEDELYDDSLDIDPDDNTLSGCRSCGGPYPYCKDSCPMFND